MITSSPFRTPLLSGGMAMLLLGMAAACDLVAPEHPLHQAVAAGDIAAVKQQLKKGAKVDEGSLNALHRAIIAKDIKMAELLIAHGADIEKRTAPPYKLDKFTPLVLAIYGGSAEMVTLLLKSGADPNVHAGTHDYSPLRWALIMAAPEPASALLAHLPLKQLEEEHVLHQVAASLTPSLITDLAKRKVDLNAKNADGDTALHVAVKSGPIHIDAPQHGEAIALLLKHGANPNATDKWGQGPVFRAVLKAMAVTHVLQVNAGPDPIVHHGPPIEWPPAQTHPHAIKILQNLLDGGANPDLKDQKGFTPRDLAKAAGEFETIAKIMDVTNSEVRGGGTSHGPRGRITLQGGHVSTVPLQIIIQHRLKDW